MAKSELDKMIDRLRNRDFICLCDRKFMLNYPETYEHSGGLMGDDGKRCWLYYVCPFCEHQWAWGHIIRSPWRLEGRQENGNKEAVC